MFLIVYLFSTTEFYQLLKLPVVAAHYMEHKRNSSHITIAQFLRIHYLMDIKDADYERDMQLPFKTQDKHIAVVTNIYTPLNNGVSISMPLIFIEDNSYKTNDSDLPATCTTDIWQPPRVC